MIAEKVEQYFNRYPHLKVLFFFDEQEEYAKEIEQITTVKVVQYANNPFIIKCQLVEELKDEKVLLYLPIEQPQTEKAYQAFPLLGLMIANKVLQLDDAGSFMEEYGIQRHQKTLLAKYMKELKYTSVQDICKPILDGAKFTELNIQRGLLSAFLKFKEIKKWELIIGKLLLLSNPKGQKEFQRVYNKIKGVGIEDEVCKKIEAIIGISIKSISPASLKEVAVYALYNKLTQGIIASKNDPYAKLKIDKEHQITQLNQFFTEVEHSSFATEFSALLAGLNKDIQGEKLIAIYGVETEFVEYSSEMIWAVIEQSQQQIFEAPQVFKKRITAISLQEKIDESVLQAMRYFSYVSALHESIQSFGTCIFNTPEEYIETYTSKGYLIDSNYRKAISAYRRLDETAVPKNIDLESIYLQLNEAYDQHTEKLNREWLKCLNQFEFNYSKITTSKQFDFYKNEIENTDQKLVVIISDALRFEAAQELLSTMHADPKNTAEMKYMLASIPSKTNVGMCQLLPGEKAFNDGTVSASGITTTSIPERSKVLAKEQVGAQAIQFSDLEGKSSDARRELFKAPVVYIYHDVIDSTGDKRASERRTFQAVEEAIAELFKLVKSLHASMNVSKVIITADHGFLYTDKAIEERDLEKVDKTDLEITHNRYFISKTKQERELSYSIPLAATTAFKDDLWVNIPYSTNRYRKGGVGHQFVHGGGSLQELVVPLIESSRKREKVSRKVNPMLLNDKKLRIVSSILKVNILQEYALSRNEKERTITIGLYSGTNLVSNKETVLLNATSESPTDRMVRRELILNNETEQESFLKLKIFDVEDDLNPLIEKTVENQTLIQSDF